MSVDWRLIREQNATVNQRNKQIRFMRKMLKALKFYIEKANMRHSIPEKVWSWLSAEVKKK